MKTSLSGPDDLKDAGDVASPEPPPVSPANTGAAAGRSVNVVGGVTSMMLGAGSAYGMLATAHIPDPNLTAPLVILGGIAGFVCWLLPTFQDKH